MEGINLEETTPSRKLMFQAGVSNEDIWYDTIKDVWDGPILREEEVATYWKTKNGIEVTGRPDIVLCTDDARMSDEQTEPRPVVGIELKLVSALWTGRDALFEGKPKFNHLCQAAHYSWQLDIPFELWYTNRVDFATNDIANRVLPKYGTDKFKTLEEHLEVGYYRQTLSRSGRVYGKAIREEEFLREEANRNYGFDIGQVYVSTKKFYPFAVGFVLEWIDDTLYYTSTEFPEESPTKTLITKQNIESFFNHVASMPETDDLGPRPLTLKGDGKPANYTICTYCPKFLDDACNKTSYKEWIEEVRKNV